MKPIFYSVIMLLCMFTSTAQNLVPNPGFEDYDNCPTSFGEIACPLTTPPFAPTVKNWISPVPNSPDYYNKCSASIYATVPTNFYGHQPAHNGDAYVGLATLTGYLINDPTTMYLEYVETKLINSLEAGKRYKVSCFVKLAFHIDPLHILNIVGLHELGASFTKARYTSLTTPLSGSFIGMHKPGNVFITDTANWVEITAEYTAKGGEEWLTIGRFNTGIIPLYQPVFPGTPAPLTVYQSYYLIDDVSVTAQPPCDTVAINHDTLLCSIPLSGYTITSSGSTLSTYKWNTGDITKSLTIDKSGKYWCTAQNDCHLQTDTFNITILQDTIFTIKNISLCNATDYLLSSHDNANSYIWNTGELTKAITTNGFGNYWCAAVLDCKLYLDTFNLTIKELPIDFVPLNDINICHDELVTVGKIYPGVIKYQWSNGDTTCCISPYESGQYIVNIISNCDEFTDTIDVNVNRCSDCLFIPNAFTPNADGLNDYFGIKSLCDIDKFIINIYNRWGQRVFTSNDVNFRWNGLQKADYAQTGTYYYYLKYNTVQKTEMQHLKGDITLLR